MNLPPCEHPLVVDEPSEEAFREAEFSVKDAASLRRRCLLCGFYYNRTNLLSELRDDMSARWRVTLDDIRMRKDYR